MSVDKHEIPTIFREMTEKSTWHKNCLKETKRIN